MRHDNQFEKKGLYPVVLEYLFNKRVELKAHLDQLGKKRRHLEKMISSARERGKTILESLISEYSFICFDYDYSDSKQRALKVYMNTFYGEAGNLKSPIFLRELAGRTTSARKYNLNLVTDFISKKGFGIKYGDTDSLYVACPDRYYWPASSYFFTLLHFLRKISITNLFILLLLITPQPFTTLDFRNK